MEELVVADPVRRALSLWRPAPDGAYQEGPASALLGVTAADLSAAIAWPDDSD